MKSENWLELIKRLKHSMKLSRKTLARPSFCNASKIVVVVEDNDDGVFQNISLDNHTYINHFMKNEFLSLSISSRVQLHYN